jgi:hypothetical protein
MWGAHVAVDGGGVHEVGDVTRPWCWGGNGFLMQLGPGQGRSNAA